MDKLLFTGTRNTLGFGYEIFSSLGAFVGFVGNSNWTVKSGQLRNKHFCTNHHQIDFHLGRGPPKTSCKLQGVGVDSSRYFPF